MELRRRARVERRRPRSGRRRTRSRRRRTKLAEAIYAQATSAARRGGDGDGARGRRDDEVIEDADYEVVDEEDGQDLVSDEPSSDPERAARAEPSRSRPRRAGRGGSTSSRPSGASATSTSTRSGA